MLPASCHAHAGAGAGLLQIGAEGGGVVDFYHLQLALRRAGMTQEDALLPRLELSCRGNRKHKSCSEKKAKNVFDHFHGMPSFTRGLGKYTAVTNGPAFKAPIGNDNKCLFRFSGSFQDWTYQVAGYCIVGIVEFGRVHENPQGKCAIGPSNIFCSGKLLQDQFLCSFLPWLKTFFGCCRQSQHRGQQADNDVPHCNLPSFHNRWRNLAHLTECAKSGTMWTPRENGGAGFGSPKARGVQRAIALMCAFSMVGRSGRGKPLPRPSCRGLPTRCVPATLSVGSGGVA